MSVGPAPGHDLIVVGASAGGIEALSRFVATLPSNFPAPIVIAQHLEPSRVSHLQEILARRSSLPVRTVSQHQRLEPGVVYVVPSNRDVEITDHSIDLQSDLPGRPKPSIDRLLETAAATFGERLIAVILTGTGSDGADGARRVNEAGGTVVVQDPETAQFPELPRSLAPTTVDIVADLDAIGPLLRALDDTVELEVRDYGPGFPPEEASRLFSSFYQVTRGQQGVGQGLGLGLYIAHEIVTGHGGTIGVDSTPGEGARFVVRLPRLSGEAPT